MTLVGTEIRGIKIEKLLAEGGMGEVYLGHDDRLKRRVALKTVRADRRLDEASAARFRREAQTLSQLEHHESDHREH